VSTGSAPVRDHAAILASAVGFGVGTALSVVALHGLRPADLLAVELGGSAVILLVVAAALGRLRRRGAVRAMAQGALTPGLAFLLGDLGLARTTAASGSLLLSTEAVLTVGLAVLVLGERIGAAAATALACGVGGAVLVALGAQPAPATQSGNPPLGNLLVLASVACGSVFIVWTRRSASRSDTGGLGTTGWQFLGAAVAVTPFVLGTWLTVGSQILAARPATLLAAAAVLSCGLGGLLLFNVGIATVSASRAALLQGLEPVAGTVTAVLVLGEPLRWAQVLGGVLILVGLVLLTRDRPAPRPQPPRPAEPPRRLHCARTGTS
jgi:drug/metabolite transporter (DMT)-like permease